MERRLSRYIHLTCGHLTTWETDMVYRMGGSPRDKYFCEKHGRWVKAVKYKPAPIPEEPLF